MFMAKQVVKQTRLRSGNEAVSFRERKFILTCLLRKPVKHVII